MSDSALSRYVEIKQQIAALEEELDSLKEGVFTEVDARGGEIANESFVIRSYKQPKYRFSQTYEAKNNELKEMKKQEIDDGTAVIDGYSEFVKLNLKKNAG